VYIVHVNFPGIEMRPKFTVVTVAAVCG